MVKFMKNVEQDEKVTMELINLGWQVIVVWECEIAKPDELLNKVSSKLI